MDSRMRSDFLDTDKIDKDGMRKRKGSNSQHEHQVSVVPWAFVLLRELIAQALQRLL